MIIHSCQPAACEKVARTVSRVQVTASQVTPVNHPQRAARRLADLLALARRLKVLQRCNETPPVTRDVDSMRDETASLSLTFQTRRVLLHAAAVLLVEGERPDSFRGHHVLLLRAGAAHQLRVVSEQVATHESRLVALAHREAVDG